MEANKILCVGNWESDVGYAWWLMERFWEAIALRYPGRVTVSYSKLRNIPERLSRAGIEFVEHDFNVSKPLSSFVKKHDIGHIYLTDKPYYCSAYAQLRSAGVKSIIVHDHSPGDRSAASGMKRIVKAVLARVPLQAADAYIAVSDMVMRRFAETACLPARKCHLAANGIDMDVAPNPVDIRAELGIPSDALVVVSASRATQYKRIHHIIEAAARLRNVYFVHCGDGPDLPFFNAEISRLRLEKRFFLVGRREDVPGILASADIGVHASAGEVGTSLSIMEFARAGLPIVLPNSPSVAGGFKDDVTALIYEPGNIAHLAANLSLLAGNAELRSSIGGAAKTQSKSYDIQRTIGAVLNVFEQLQV
jgi:glycosyltransferase involved in cell wall biosynthesis